MGVPFLRVQVFAAAVIFALALAGCHGSDSGNGDVAVVGKDPISMKEYYDYLQRKPTFITTIPGRGDAQVPIKNSPGYQAMEDLIVNHIILQLAKEKNVYPTDKAVDDEVAFQKKGNPHLLDEAFAQGYTMDEIKADIRVSLARFNLSTQGQTVTSQEVDDFIKNNPAKFMESEKIQAGIITVRTDAEKKAVIAELKGGQPFLTVAKQHSLDTNGARTNYQFQTTDTNQMAPQLKKLLDATPELKWTDWQSLGTNQGFVMFYIEKKIPPKPIEMTELIRERVRRALLQQKGAKANINLTKMIADSIQAKKKDIKIMLKQNQAPWENFTMMVDQALTEAHSQQTGVGATGSLPGSGAPSGSTPAPSESATKAGTGK